MTPNSISSQIKTRVLWRVYLVWFFKRILPLLVLEVVILGLAVYLLAKYVFIEKVVSNTLFAAGRNPLIAFSYLFSAFLGTTLINKIVIIVLFSLGALLLRDLGRALASYRSTSRVVARK